jgi:hypothetical protein
MSFIKKVVRGREQKVIIRQRYLLFLQPFRPRPTHALFILVIWHLKFLDLFRIGLIFTDDVEVVVEVGPVRKLEVARIQPQYGL